MNAAITFTLTVDDGVVSADLLDVTVTNAPIEPPTTPPDPCDAGEITLSSIRHGMIQITWDAPGDTLGDSCIVEKVGDNFLTWSGLTGNVFPTPSNHTMTDLY